MTGKGIRDQDIRPAGTDCLLSAMWSHWRGESAVVTLAVVW